MKLKKVPDFETLSGLLMKYHIRRGIVTNNFISGERRSDCIAADSLSCHVEGENLFLLEDREVFFRLYFDITDTGVLPTLDTTEKPVVTEIVLRPGDEKTVSVLEAFSKSGFHKTLKRERMQRGSDRVSGDRQGVVPAVRADAEAVRDLLNRNFDSLTGCLPSSQELLREIDAGMILKLSVEDRIAGLLHFSADKKGVEIRHLAVYEQYRGRGIASRLLSRCLTEYGGGSRLWVSTANEAAKAFYQKHGFSADGWESYVMIKKQK